MNKGLIGIIVPVYKVEKYIAECIESILAQTYTKFRLILVDDGTPDNAGKICDEYAKKDSRIMVIHQENAGVTRARARGVEEAKDCEWITFVDSDDYLPINAIKILHSFTNDRIDIIAGEYEFKRAGFKLFMNKYEYIGKLISNTSEITQAPWAKLFRKELFTNEIFNIPKDILVGEDLIMNIRLSANCTKTLIYTTNIVYNYRIREDSAIHTFLKKLSYQAYLFKIIKSSIPKEYFREVMPLIIKEELQKWGEFYLYSCKNTSLEDYEFVNTIKKEIETYKYKTTVFEWVQLYCPYKVIKYTFIGVHKIINKISQLHIKLKIQ